VEIRVLDEGDAEMYWEIRLEALRLHPEAFGSDYEESLRRPIEKVRERIRENRETGSFTLGAFEGGEIVGTTGFFREEGVKERHRGFIWGVYVRPQYREQGIARKLMQEAIRKASAVDGVEQIHLMVTTINTGARQLYRSLGFEEYGIEPRALKVGNEYYDEAMMVLLLK
jgi:ribosomal protein S18 acetylase RimI-like enzyme